MSLRLRVVEAPAGLAQALAIRHEVFVREQLVPVEEERDAADDTAIHVLAVLDGVPVGTGRLVVEPPDYLSAWGVPEGGPLGHLGRIAVLPAQRGTGVGAAATTEVRRVLNAHRKTTMRTPMASRATSGPKAYENELFTVLWCCSLGQCATCSRRTLAG